MAAKRPKLCCAEAGGMGPCAEPRREDSYFCDRHDRQWIERGNRIVIALLGEQAANEAVA